MWYAVAAHVTAGHAPDAGTATTRGPVAVSPDDLRALAGTLGHPVYWVGPREDTTYELVQSANGSVVIRYLPAGVPVGAAGSYLAVATYPMANALAVTRDAAGADDVTIEIPGGGVAIHPRGNERDIHAAFPEANAQAEVFAPEDGAALELVTSGSIAPVGG